MVDDLEWLEWRRAGVTATDVADAAAGTYGGLYAVVARKLGLVTVEQTAAMTRGHRWQPRIADAVHALTGQFVVGEETWCENRDRGWMRATVDGFLAPAAEATLSEVTAVLEVKTRGVGTRPNRDRWEAQVQWQMLVTGVDSAVIAEAVVDDVEDAVRSVTLTDVAADPDRQAELVAVGERIRACVAAGKLPTPDTPDALPVVKAVHASAADRVAALPDLESDVERFAALRAEISALTAERDLVEARIREAVGDATKVRAGGWTVTVSQPARVVPADAAAEFLETHPEFGRTVLDVDRLRVEAPDLFDGLRVPAGARRMTVKQAKEEPSE